MLTHTLPGDVDVLDFLGGWHWHLDALATATDRVVVTRSEPAWRALRDKYADVMLSA